MPGRNDALTVSVVIPVHNEADYLGGALDRLFAELDTVPAETNVILAENGSTDATAAIAATIAEDHPELSLLQLSEPDYGAAMRAGFLASKGDWVVNFDIDYFSGPFLKQVIALSTTADVVLASKRAPGSEDRRSPVRRLATYVFNLLLRVLLESGVSDTHGMKALRREVVDDVAPAVVSTQDLFDTELVVRAERAGYRIAEVPVRVEEDRDAKSSLFSRVPRTVRGVWKIRASLRS